MKKLLLLSLFAIPFIAQAAITTDPAKNLVAGVKLIKNHKAEWLNHEQDLHNAKYKLLIDEHNAMFDRKIKHVEKFANSSIAEYDKAVLDSMIESHKNNMQKWHDLCMTYQTKAKSIYERQLKEIANFETTVLGKAPAEEAEEEEMTVIELVK